MVYFFIPALIIFGFLALLYIVDNICDVVKKYRLDTKNEDLDRLKRRIKYLEDNIVEEWRISGDIGVLTKKVDAVYKWRKNVLKGYCYKMIEFEEKENKAHFLAVVYDLHKDRVLHTKHVECELVSKFSAQDCVKKHAVEITLEQATDYLEQGFVWVPTYEKKANWPAINEVME